MSIKVESNWLADGGKERRSTCVWEVNNLENDQITACAGGEMETINKCIKALFFSKVNVY